MSFADIPENTNKAIFKATEYVKITSGVPLRLRVLDTKAVHQVRHYIPSQKASILCLGDETCPICQTNVKLMRDNPNENPREIRGFIPRQNRYLVNVLNRTMVKISPSGKVVFATGGQFPAVDPETGEPLVNIEINNYNKVQVLDRGPELFEQLNMVNDATVNEMGNPTGLTNFDISIMASGAGRKMKTNVQALANLNDKVEVADEDKYILSTMGILLTPSEIENLLKGVSLKDLFAARRATKEAESSLVTESNPDVARKVNNLFGN